MGGKREGIRALYPCQEEEKETRTITTTSKKEKESYKG